MAEIGKALYAQMLADFQANLKANERIQALEAQIRKGKGSYETAAEYARLVGEQTSRTLRHHLTAEVLPGGGLSYNLAAETLRPMLTQDYMQIRDVATTVQQTLNTEAGLGLKPQVPRINVDRVEGLMKRISQAESIEDAEWLLDEPVVNFSQSVVDDFVKENAGKHRAIGLKPKVRRITAGKCCTWCDALAGTYNFGEEPADFFRRHERCRCVVTYHPASGRRQDVHTKKWSDEQS